MTAVSKPAAAARRAPRADGPSLGRLGRLAIGVVLRVAMPEDEPPLVQRPDLRAYACPDVDEIGLFPLGMVLLPTEQVPLHIFEPRYRELIGECLEDEREFGLVFADEDGLRAIGTRAAVTEVLERFDDGRLNIVVEGRARFRLVEVSEGATYHTGSIEPVVDQTDPADDETKERAVELFHQLVEITGSEVDDPDLEEAQLSFALAARFEFAPTVK